jgi:photosystem II stability/assembly factor-like uncharacterized protein
MVSGRRLYFSDSVGASWRLRAVLPWFISVLQIDPVDSKHLFAAVQYHGIMESHDGGKNWTAIGLDFSNPFDDHQFTSTVLSANHPQRLYVTTLDAGIYESNDGGSSWGQPAVQPGDGHVWTRRASPVNPKLVFAGTDKGLYRSIDGGKSWSAVIGPLNRGFDLVRFDPANPAVIVVGGFCCHVLYRSADNGDSWARVPVPKMNGTPRALQFVAAKPGVAYMALDSLTGDGVPIVRSNDGGQSWTALSNPGKVMSADAHAIYVNPRNPQQLVIGTKRGIFISLDAGRHWSASNTGFENGDLDYIAPDPDTPGVIWGVSSSQGVFESNDGGRSWEARNGAFGDTDMRVIAVDPLNPGTVYTQLEYGEFYFTHNAGKTWSHSQIGASTRWPNMSALLVDPNNSNVLYARDVPDNGVLKSEDAGMHWTLKQSGLPNIEPYAAHDYHALVMSKANPNILYLGTAKGIYKSVDAAATWQESDGGLSSNPKDRYVATLAIDPMNPKRVFAVIANHTGRRRLWKTKDGGNSWHSVDSGLDGVAFKRIVAIAIDPNDPQHLLLADSAAGLFASIDGGNRWVPFNNEEQHRNPYGYYDIKALCFDPFASNRYYIIVANHPETGTEGGSGSVNASKAHLEIYTGRLATDLSITFAGHDDPVHAGDTITDSFTVTNRSDVPAKNIRVALKLKGDVKLHSVKFANKSCPISERMAKCKLEQLVGGSKVKGNARYSILSPRPITIKASVNSNVQDESTDDNSVTSHVEATAHGKGVDTSGGNPDSPRSERGGAGAVGIFGFLILLLIAAFSGSQGDRGRWT